MTLTAIFIKRAHGGRMDPHLSAALERAARKKRFGRRVATSSEVTIT